ncbi:lipid droplet-associated protein [Parasphingorhabdus pacifica]
MRSFPLPVRLAAGLAATAVEQTRQLPGQLLGLPVTVASQALQASMRVQQQVTELAIKGDEALSVLHTPAEQPEWATFDEDDPPRPSPWDRVDGDTARNEGTAHEGDSTSDPRILDDDLSILPEYDHLSLPQLRGKLRGFSEAELTRLLEHEQAHGMRPEFVRMLSKRLERLQTEQ